MNTFSPDINGGETSQSAITPTDMKSVYEYTLSMTLWVTLALLSYLSEIRIYSFAGNPPSLP